ncbi:MAG: carboxypeptidase regulatory-like domain-containing protein [Oceanicaulis sp.]|uniref:carboxypeptidase-like regulatory domain-containing protein n=1 Tax=Glycocaulis sp. TaxID=1969725 RepID=UPI0025B89E49|nr:carboxypeptidase-like regulatory domain-containing protein [Glycocaulis sp.]MCC5981781.1 carboxypeptidase regulatory-like domain-containing protein [Oceanicaulis sp.]MCH8522026.1 carboxypeptidase-like regulatory domain-containing protein [Glycocaulis sp.]
MNTIPIRAGLVTLMALALMACAIEREHVLAPDTHGLVVDADTLAPVQGAQVRFEALTGSLASMTDEEGRFSLEGRTEMRRVMPVVGGVYRDSSRVHASASGYESGYSSAAFINGLGPAQAEFPVIVVLFPQGIVEPDLARLMADCLETPEQRHAVHVAARLAELDRETLPGWLDADAVLGLEEHISLVLQPSLLLGCEQTQAAHETLQGHLSAFRAAAAVRE